MDSDDSDLQAFESNLHAVIWVCELCKIAALVSKLCQNASDPQLVHILRKENAQHKSRCGTSSHGQSDPDNLTDGHETSTEWKFEGYLYFLAARWPAGKAYAYAFWAEVGEQYIHQLFLFLSTAWNFLTILWQIPKGNCWNCWF